MAINKLENGRWRVSVYQNKESSRIRKVFKTRDEARKFETIAKGELAKGTIFKSKQKEENFGAFIANWHLRRKHVISEGTFKRIESNLNSYIFPILGSYNLTDINADRLNELRNQMLSKVKKQTVKNCEAILRTALKDATKERKIPFYPLDAFGQLKVDDASKIQPLSNEDQNKLLEASKEHSNNVNDQRRFMLYSILLNTGMRYGELCGLKWKDINLEKKELKIERQCIFIENDTQPKLSELKTKGSKRTILLDNKVMENIKIYELWVNKTMFDDEKFKHFLTETPFIQHTNGGHLNKNFGRSTMSIITKKAGLPHYSVHGLRHTHATNLANTEIPIIQIQTRLGHSNITTTMDRYAKPRIEESRKYLELISK